MSIGVVHFKQHLKPPIMTTDEQTELLTRLKTKDVKAVKTLVVQYTDDLYLVATLEVKSAIKAYDFVSDFIMELYANGFEEIRPPIKVSLMARLREALEVERLIPQ
jgi:hypothetical protein